MQMNEGIIKQVVYSSAFSKINKFLLSFLYDRSYLNGKFFDEHRYGFVWAWKCAFRSFSLRRRGIRWPIAKGFRLASGRNIHFDPSSLNIFQQPGCYYQNYNGKISIGKDVWIAQNVGLITENHDPNDPEKHLPPKNIVIGDKCWIGMNVVILGGVTLGDKTTVGAGAIVTHSFPGNCIIAGNPARLIKKIDENKK